MAYRAQPAPGPPPMGASTYPPNHPSPAAPGAPRPNVFPPRSTPPYGQPPAPGPPPASAAARAVPPANRYPDPPAGPAPARPPTRENEILEQIRRERAELRQALEALNQCSAVRRREEAAVQQMTTELERMKARKDRLLRAKESRREAPSPPPRAPAASPPRAGKGKGGAYRPRSRTPPPRNRSPPPPTHAPPRTRSPPPPTHAAKRRNISTERPRDESAWDRRDFGHRYVREEPKREEPKPEQNVSLTLSGLEGSTEAELKANVEKLLQEFESRGTIPRVQSCDTDAGKVTVKVSVPGARRILTELTTTKVTLVRSNLPSLLAQLQETVSIKLWRLPKNATVGGLRNILEEFGQPTDVWVQDANDIGDWPYLCGRVTFDSPSACRRAALGLHLVKHYPGAPCSMVVSLPRETFGIGSSVLVSMPKGVQSDQLKDVMSSVGKVVSISQFPDEKDDAREKAVVVFKHPGDAKDACKKLMPKAITVQKPDVNKDLM